MYVIGKRVPSGVLILGVIHPGMGGRVRPALSASPVAVSTQCAGIQQRATAALVKTPPLRTRRRGVRTA